jgi:hypothetical protein
MILETQDLVQPPDLSLEALAPGMILVAPVQDLILEIIPDLEGATPATCLDSNLKIVLGNKCIF